MNMLELVRATRSFRRFEPKDISLEELRELVNLARLTASAGNKQPLRYILVTDPKVREEIFPYLGWAAYLPEFKGPKPEERPTAYIAFLLKEEEMIKEFSLVDVGIAAQTILLAAREKGIGGCLIGSLNKKKLEEILEIEPGYRLFLVLALGYPKEKVVLEEGLVRGDIKYFRDEQDVHHVPKRTLQEVILKEK